jgi:hypothetical protein
MVIGVEMYFIIIKISCCRVPGKRAEKEMDSCRLYELKASIGSPRRISRGRIGLLDIDCLEKLKSFFVPWIGRD